MPTHKLFVGDVLEVLRTFPDESVDCIVTSPPYWGLRDYGENANVIWGGDTNCEHEFEVIKTRRPPNASGGKTNFANEKFNIKGKENFREFVDYHNRVTESSFCKKCGAWFGQLGLEPTLELYLKHMLQITAELKRVLKKTGVMFWNHGDCYGGSGAGTWRNAPKVVNSKEIYHLPYGSNPRRRDNSDVKPKCMALQNYRAVMRMVDEQGWILRNIIIWHKPNHMPSSVKDRFSNAYEPVFVLVKNKNYWFDLDAVRVPQKDNSIMRAKFEDRRIKDMGIKSQNRQGGLKANEVKLSPLGKNPSDFWDDELLGKLFSTYIKERDEKGRIILVGRKYGLDENYFKKIDTPEKAYWFGFLFADGSMNKDRNRIIIGLSQKDEYLLEWLKLDLQSEQPLEYEIFNGSPCVFLRLNSKKMAEDLVKSGIKTSKAFDNVPEQLLNHFIRGLFDGDGWIRYRTASNGVSIDFEVGFVNKDIEVVKKVQRILKDISGSQSERIREYKGGFDFAISGRKQVEKIGWWLYKDATRYLIRKKNIFPQFLNDTSDVLTIPTEPFPEAHFATFPTKLIEPMIQAGCPQWICKKCGKARERIVEVHRPPNYDPSCKAPYADKVHPNWNNRPLSKIFYDTLRSRRETVGWTDCGCNAGWRSGVVLDPFMGSGTTMIVAERLGRDSIGIELNPEYVEIARKRFKPFEGQVHLDGSVSKLEIIDKENSQGCSG